MNIKAKYIVAVIAAVTLPLSWAAADVNLRFNNGANNQTNGVTDIINATPGSQVTVTLQLNTTSQMVDTVDYWLSQFSGPTAGAISIFSRDRTGSAIGDNPSSNDAAVAANTDTQSNSAVSGAADGVPDDTLNPRNAFNLGAGTPTAGSTGGDLGAGTYLVATYTFDISNTAAAGLYEIRSFDYANRGWSDTVPGANQTFDQAFTNQAAIRINLIPEPGTWSLLALGGLGSFALRLVRSRRLLG